jgi:hypothetical protein
MRVPLAPGPEVVAMLGSVEMQNGNEGADAWAGHFDEVDWLHRQLARMVDERFEAPFSPRESEWYRDLIRRELSQIATAKRA